MTMRDVFSGQPGEWRGGMWFPDQQHPNQTMRDNPPLTLESAAVLSKVWSEHSRDAGKERIDRISLEFEKQCYEHNLRQKQLKQEMSERRAWFVAFLIVGFFMGLWVAHLLWGI